ncbi:unnamed protein product [Peronospora belbahrii]|uniref:Trs120/TRAPPC9 N-terminal domain-containing protein n=1 Tax=Peronospora belbahrii TaxID=622444 RepID=A0ABN8D9I4_9STRA|nr:unnamed protein product [Peronospora belbahrii]
MSSSAVLLQWTRPAEFLVYLVPVGNIPPDLFASYTRLLQTHSILPFRSLTRPGGYLMELSPFHGLDWTGPGSIRFHFVSTAQEIEIYDGEDAHASHRVIGALGVCHSPSLSLLGGLRTAYLEFKASVKHFPGLLMQKLFAFEHTFEDITSSECKGLDDLIMFPMHHEIQDMDESTVSLHLQVVMDTLAVNILMSLESAIRSATSTVPSTGLMTLSAPDGDLASILLDVNVEPQQTHVTHQSESSPIVLSNDTKVNATFNAVSSPAFRSLGSPFSSIPSPLTAGVAALDSRNRRRKRQLARKKKLLGDYHVLVSCISDAVEQYTIAIEMLREEERRSGSTPGDALWLAAALEGYVFCLYTELNDKFSTELVEKASEAVAFYAKAGTVELESLFIQNLGSYYARVAMATLTSTSMTGEAKLLESVWMKRLLWDVLERGMVLFPELPPQRQIEFLIQTSYILETVSHRRRAALFLHEAASLLLNRNAPSVDTQAKVLLSPTSATKEPQRQRDLEAALILERVAAELLGIQGQSTRKGDVRSWKVTIQHRRKRGKKSSGPDTSMVTQDDAWLIIRFHLLRQLLVIARMLGDAFLVGTYCLQLLEMLVWCDSIAALPNINSPHTCSPPFLEEASTSQATLQVDHLQRPATFLRVTHLPVDRIAAGLHAKSGVYLFPPPGIDTKVKRNFLNSPSATMSNAAASLSSTLTNTPRILATPRQQLSAAVTAISTKASPAFAQFSNAYHQHNGSMSGRPGGVDDCTATNIVDEKEFGKSSINGDGGYESSQLVDAVDNNLDETLHFDAATAPNAVWDLRSKTEIAKIERQLLSMLESDCAGLRSKEQMRLPTFLKMDILKLRSSCNLKDPFLSRVTALQMFRAQSAISHQAVKSEFFYSPFDKQKMRVSDHRGRSDRVEDSDDMHAMYERGFPACERIELQLTLSNPTGVVVKLQEVRVWVTLFKEDDGGSKGNGSTNSATKDGDVECYPCFFVLEPYQKHKSVVLSIQPLRAGTFHVRGCFIKAFNIETSFELENPISFFVVREVPKVSLSLHEHNSMMLSSGENVAMSREPIVATTRLALFMSETRRCTICVRNTGNSYITNYRLAVSIQHRRAATKTCVIFNNLPLASATTEDNSVEVSHSTTNKMKAIEPEKGMVDTEFLSFKYRKVVSSLLPLASGDIVSIPFEISLRGNCEPAGDNIQLEWCVVYADEAPVSSNDIGDSGKAIFYRESKLALELVLLPSLMLQSVTLLSCCAEQIPMGYRPNGGNPSAACDVSHLAEVVTTDHLYCIIMVHIVNPTETSFRFRLRHDTASFGEEEIGRQCSRRFIVEVPRLQSSTLCQGPPSLADVLNDLVKMEWETHFGNRGRLLCEDHHVGSSVDQRQAKVELFLPPVCFQIQSPHQDAALVRAGEKQNGDMDVLNSQRGRSISLHTSSSFQLSHVRVKLQRLQIGLFKYVPITIAAQPRAIEDQVALGVEMEVIITEEGEKGVCEMSEHVVVVGQLRVDVQWDERMDRSTKFHEIQCMFLSEGNFRVTVCGRVLSSDMKQFGRKIWCHQPIHVCVQSENATVSDKVVTTI